MLILSFSMCIASATETVVDTQEAQVTPSEGTTEPPNIIDSLSLGVDTDKVGIVDKQLTYLTQTIRESFALYLKRSGRYLDLMREILIAKGMPEDLAFLPLVESGFNLHARSRKKAVGPWQFIASTARLYGLKINSWVDERKDPVKSTIAAAEYLNNLYDMFGSWSLAMAAYNAGEGKILRALRRSKIDDFWPLLTTRHIVRETKDYVPRFIAARLIAKDPALYGFDNVDYEEAFLYEEVVVEGAVDLEIIARCTNTTTADIEELNPELIRSCTPHDVKEYTVRIPHGSKEEFIKNFSNIPEKDRYCTRSIPYTVKRGDTLSKISKRTGIPLSIILEMNHIKKNRLKEGQILYLPPKRVKRG